MRKFSRSYEKSGSWHSAVRWCWRWRRLLWGTAGFCSYDHGVSDEQPSTTLGPPTTPPVNPDVVPSVIYSRIHVNGVPPCLITLTVMFASLVRQPSVAGQPMPISGRSTDARVSGEVEMAAPVFEQHVRCKKPSSRRSRDHR